MDLLNKYLDQVNQINNTSLTWSWYSDQSFKPMVHVYELTVNGGKNTICISIPQNIISRTNQSLVGHGLLEIDLEPFQKSLVTDPVEHVLNLLFDKDTQDGRPTYHAAEELLKGESSF